MCADPNPLLFALKHVVEITKSVLESIRIMKLSRSNVQREKNKLTPKRILKAYRQFFKYIPNSPSFRTSSKNIKFYTVATHFTAIMQIMP